MTPTREWLRRNEIEELIDGRVERLFVEHNRKIDQRLNSQDLVLKEIRTTQDNFHDENRRRLDRVEKDTKNILQFQELEQQRLKIREEDQTNKDKTWDRWKNRITVAAGIMTLFGALGISNYVHRLILSGHLFPPVH